MQRVLRAAGLALGFALLAAMPASAEITNGCAGSLAGQDVGARSSTDPNQAIQVRWDQSAEARVVSAAPITGYHVDLEFAGIPFTVAHGTSNGNTWTQPVEVRQYAIYGVGLYKVIGTSTGPGACSASFLVNITGKDPLSTPVGQAAAAILAIGALGTIAATVASATGTPVHARPYISDLQLVESNQLPESALRPYFVDAVNVPLEQDFHYVPDAISVDLPEAPPSYPSDAINMDLPETQPSYPSDAINVNPGAPQHMAAPGSNVPGPPPRRGG